MALALDQAQALAPAVWHTDLAQALAPAAWNTDLALDQAQALAPAAWPMDLAPALSPMRVSHGCYVPYCFLYFLVHRGC